MKYTDMKHAEAFCLMQYESADGTVARTIWNSRDGVTPFSAVIDGEETTHVRWGEDVFAPDHIPADDDLVFATIHRTLEQYVEMYRNIVNRAPQSAPPEGPERDRLIQQLAEGVMAEYGEEGTVGVVTGAEWKAMQKE